ncbi:unnamed protein product [Somion occarium]|uniref:F-box domain-containing protein n=1 Tax=Somion occarium TaxID=3059160 RepID=A0ABP1D6L3_9APHY
MKPTLTGLPSELIEIIFHELPFADSTSRFIHDVFKHSARLQYPLELAFAGMEDVSINKTNPREKLRMLRRYEDTWSRVSLGAAQHLCVNIGDSFDVCENVFMTTHDPHSIEFHLAPGPFRGVSPHKWSLRFDFEIVDYYADPTQDLLVLLELKHQSDVVQLHAVSLLTGKLHPLAAKSELFLHVVFLDTDERNYRIRICGCHVAAYVDEYLDGEDIIHHIHFGVWNWQTGQSRMFVAEPRIRSFAFLDEYHIAVTHGDLTRVGIMIKNLAEPDSQRPTFLAYPDMSPSHSTPFLMIECRPHHNVVDSSSVAKPMFRSRSEDGIAVLSLTVFEPDDTILPVNFVVRAKDLLAIPYRQETWTWEEWGPQITRWLDGLDRMQDVYPPCGSKYAFLSNDDQIVVYDFNPASINKTLSLGNEDKVETILEARVHELPVFVCPVSTSLPCRRYTVTIPIWKVEKMEEVMLMDDGIAVTDLVEDAEGEPVGSRMHIFTLQ